MTTNPIQTYDPFINIYKQVTFNRFFSIFLIIAESFFPFFLHLLSSSGYTHYLNMYKLHRKNLDNKREHNFIELYKKRQISHDVAVYYWPFTCTKIYLFASQSISTLRQRETITLDGPRNILTRVSHLYALLTLMFNN